MEKDKEPERAESDPPETVISDTSNEVTNAADSTKNGLGSNADDERQSAQAPDQAANEQPCSSKKETPPEEQETEASLLKKLEVARIMRGLEADIPAGESDPSSVHLDQDSMEDMRKLVEAFLKGCDSLQSVDDDSATKATEATATENNSSDTAGPSQDLAKSTEPKATDSSKETTFEDLRAIWLDENHPAVLQVYEVFRKKYCASRACPETCGDKHEKYFQSFRRALLKRDKASVLRIIEARRMRDALEAT